MLTEYENEIVFELKGIREALENLVVLHTAKPKTSKTPKVAKPKAERPKLERPFRALITAKDSDQTSNDDLVGVIHSSYHKNFRSACLGVNRFFSDPVNFHYSRRDCRVAISEKGKTVGIKSVGMYSISPI